MKGQAIDIGREEVVGRWTGEADVNFVRVYGLADAGARRPVPAWIDGLDSLTAEAEGAPDEDDLREMIMTTIKAVASAQEIHYAGNYSYTSDVTGILDGHEVRVNGRRQPFEMPEGLEITIPFANSRGWIGIFAHPGLDRVCGLAYGFNIPPGWTPGMVMCAAPTSAADQGMEG